MISLNDPNNMNGTKCIFAGMGGAGIFTAQFYGKGDGEGFKGSVRAKLRITAIMLIRMPLF